MPLTLDKMQMLASKGKMSRRDFVQLSLAAGFTVAAAKDMFVSAVRAEPKDGGFFRIGTGHGSTTDSLDPATWNNGFTADIGTSIVGDTLVEMDQNNDFVPWLAESFESSSTRYRPRVQLCLQEQAGGCATDRS